LSVTFDGKLSCNSGAKFCQNDVISDKFEIEAKTTCKKGYRITIKELRTIRNKKVGDKIPLQIVEFSETKEDYVIINLIDFLELFL
jgi:hypothetical protein